MTDLEILFIQNLNSQNDQLFLPSNLSILSAEKQNSINNLPKLQFFSTYNDQEIPAEVKQYEQEIPDIFLNLDNISNIYDINNSIDQNIINGNNNNIEAINSINNNNSQIFSNDRKESINYISNEQCQNTNNNENEISTKKIFKHKLPQQRKAKDFKNIHRYLSHQIINQMLSNNFREQTLSLCTNFNVCFERLRDYFYSKIETFNNLSKLSEHWKIEQNNDSELNQFKKVFRYFSKWFLEEKASRYILHGRMNNKNKIIYLEYKNYVMRYFIDRPEQYISNQLS